MHHAQNTLSDLLRTWGTAFPEAERRSLGINADEFDRVVDPRAMLGAP